MTQVINGLVCLYSTDRLSLLNVCTLEILDLPPAPLPSPDNYSPTTAEKNLGNARVIRNISRTNTHYYFIFDAVCKVYKVLSMTNICTRRDCTGGEKCLCKIIIFAQTLTLRGPVSSYKWKRVSKNVPLKELQTQSFCVDGFLYWMHEFPDDPPSYAPIYFDIEKDCFSGPFPLGPRLNNFYVLDKPHQFAQFGRRFSVFIRSSKWSFQVYDYMRLEGNNIWSAKGAALLPRVLTGNSFLGDIIPVGNLPSGVVLLANIRDNEKLLSASVCSYNHVTKRFKSFKAGKFPPSIASMSPMEVASCISCLEENLTPLHDRLGIEF